MSLTGASQLREGSPPVCCWSSSWSLRNQPSCWWISGCSCHQTHCWSGWQNTVGGQHQALRTPRREWCSERSGSHGPASWSLRSGTAGWEWWSWSVRTLTNHWTWLSRPWWNRRQSPTGSWRGSSPCQGSGRFLRPCRSPSRFLERVRSCHRECITSQMRCTS